MARIPNFESPDDAYKRQAERLRAFLKQGGVEIKHTNALEAIAAVHGAKDFHTLQHQAKHAEQPGALFVVNKYGTGSFVDSTVCRDFQVAIAAFAQAVRIYADLLPDERLIVAAVTGGARTEGLYCFLGEWLMVSLLQASTAEVEKNFRPLLPGIEDFDDEAVARFAYNVTAALANRKQGEWKERLNKVSNSAPAHALDSDPAEAIFRFASQAYGEASVDSDVAEATRKLIDSARVFQNMRVKVGTDGTISI